MPLATVASPRLLYRVGHPPNPFVWRPPRVTLDDAPHPHDGHRWDAPDGAFSTVYCATSTLGGLIETLSYYRRSDTFVQRMLRATGEDAPDPEYDHDAYGGRVPASYFERVLGQATLGAEFDFVDVDHPRTHAQLTRELGDLLTDHGLREFDRGIMMTQDRRITRTIAGHLRSVAAATTVGLRYESRVHRGVECWALWEEAENQLVDPVIEPLTPAIPEVVKAAALLDLQLPGGWA